MPGVVRAGRPRSQEAFIHTKNREHGLHHAGESGKTPYASLEYHPPLRGSRQDQGVARSRAGGGQTPRPVSEYSRHGQWRAYDKKCDDGLRQKQSTTRRFWSNRAFRNCRSVLETVCEVLSGPHRSLTPRLLPPTAVWRLGFYPPPHQPSPAGSASETPPQGGSDWTVDGANAILALGCVILRYRFDDFRERRAMPR